MTTLETTILVGLTLSITLFAGCKNDRKKDEPGAEASVSQPGEVSSNNINLKQDGDYSSLFDREESDCNVVTAEGIAEALQINSSNVTKKEQVSGICHYLAVFNSGTNVRVLVRFFKIPANHVKSDVRKSIEKSIFYQVKISDTGDTYLITRGRGGQVQILNPNYAGAVEIKAIESVDSGLPEHTEESRKQRYQEVVNIANYIVTNHQKQKL